MAAGDATDTTYIINDNDDASATIDTDYVGSDNSAQNIDGTYLDERIDIPDADNVSYIICILYPFSLNSWILPYMFIYILWHCLTRDLC